MYSPRPHGNLQATNRGGAMDLSETLNDECGMMNEKRMLCF
jgi:hypothetical protein